MRERDVPQILLESDSSSALQLLVGQDIPKRSRHVEIRMAWMKAKISSNELFGLNTGPERTMWEICLPNVWGPKIS